MQFNTIMDAAFFQCEQKTRAENCIKWEKGVGGGGVGWGNEKPRTHFLDLFDPRASGGGGKRGERNTWGLKRRIRMRNGVIISTKTTMEITTFLLWLLFPP